MKGKRFEISNEGQTVSTHTASYGTIRFGDFVSNENIKRFKGVFKFDDVVGGNHGIGLITSQFTDFYLHSYNYGQNHSIIFYESGDGVYMVISDEFDQNDSMITSQHHRTNITNHNPLTKNNTSVTVEIDMVQKIAKFKNDQTECCLELNNLPERIAIVFSFGLHAQKVSCIDQQFY